MAAPTNSDSPSSTINVEPRSRRWLPRSLWAFVAVLAILGVAGALFVYRYNPIRRFPERASEATGVVEAVYRFRNDTGLWPENLSEIIPAYSRGISADWEFIWGGYDNEDSSVLRLRGPLHMQLEYEFLPAGATTAVGWRATCEGDSLPVNVQQPVPILVPPNENERRKMALRILEQRVQRKPEFDEHKAALARYASQ